MSARQAALMAASGVYLMKMHIIIHLKDLVCLQGHANTCTIIDTSIGRSAGNVKVFCGMRASM